MFSGEDDSPFSNLPYEMIIEIMGYLRRRLKRRARLVCQRWRWILEHPNSRLVCFKAVLINDTFVDALLNSQLRIDNLCISGAKMTRTVMDDSQHFPVIRNIQIQTGNSEDIVITILQNGCNNVESLTLDRTSMGKVGNYAISRVLKSAEWYQLSQVILAGTIPRFDFNHHVNKNQTFERWEENHLDGMETFLQSANIPNLKKLRLDVTSFQVEVSLRMIRLILEFTRFLEKHAKTLKGLDLFISFRPLPILERNPSPMGPLFSVERQDAIASILKLESLDIRISHFDATHYLVPPCLWKSDKLTSLTWAFFWNNHAAISPPPEIHNPIQSLIKSCQKSITNVTQNYWFESNFVQPFGIPWLQSCSALKRLSLSLKNIMVVLNIEVCLPTVSHLKLKTFFYINSSSDSSKHSTWIAQTFENLTNLEITWPVLKTKDDWNCEWLENFLSLERLVEIKFFSYPYRPYTYSLDFDDFVRKFCEDTPRLNYSAPKRFEGNVGEIEDYATPRIINIFPVITKK